MAEFVNKGALMKAYKKLPIQKTAEVDCGDGFRNRPLVDLALVYEMICSQPNTTEAELRANVIDEFAEALKKICAERPLGTDREKWIPLYVHEDGTWHSLIDDVVAQMKEEKE